MPLQRIRIACSTWNNGICRKYAYGTTYAIHTLMITIPQQPMSAADRTTLTEQLNMHAKLCTMRAEADALRDGKWKSFNTGFYAGQAAAFQQALEMVNWWMLDRSPEHCATPDLPPTAK
jgi:hypothetical protein